MVWAARLFSLGCGQLDIIMFAYSYVTRHEKIGLMYMTMFLDL